MNDEERARREQYRYRLVESFFQLHQTGDSQDPSFDNIAATIGLPAGSMESYFDSEDDWHLAIAARFRQRALPLVAIDAVEGDRFEIRLRALLVQRFRLFQEYSSVSFLARMQATSLPIARDELRTARSFLHYQLKGLFGTELHQMDQQTADAALIATHVICSFESIERIREETNLPLSAISEMLFTAVSRLLAVKPA